MYIDFDTPCTPYFLVYLSALAEYRTFVLVQEQVQLKISCSGLSNALVCSPDQNYCVASIEEKILIWQVCTIAILYCV